MSAPGGGGPATPSKLVQQALARLLERDNLARAAARDLVSAIMDGEATPAQIGAVLVAWRMKGETVDEVVGAAEAMRDHATPVTTHRSPVVDTCGTGGDGSGSFNISTAAALVAAAGGVCVAKHGNRAVSSACGSADVLEELGVVIDLGPADVGHCLDRVGIGFLFAPRFHPAMRHAAAPRREIRVRSIFNLIGPLTNPAGAGRQLLGAYSARVASLLAEALARLGSERALVVHGDGGLDELALSGPSQAFEVIDGSVRSFELSPEEAGLRRRPAGLRGGDAAENAALMLAVLAGENQDLTEAVLLNAGAALLVSGRVDSLAAGVEEARHQIQSGAARRRLDEFRELTRARAAAARSREGGA